MEQIIANRISTRLINDEFSRRLYILLKISIIIADELVLPLSHKEQTVECKQGIDMIGYR